MNRAFFARATWYKPETDKRRSKTFTYEVFGGIFSGTRSPQLKNWYLVKKNEPIPLKLLRKTHVFIGSKKHKTHPITGHRIHQGQIPFGFKDINGTLQEDPMEQFVLKQAKEKRAQGASLNDIAEFLTEFGIPTKNGGRWQANTVNKILQR